MVTWDDVRRALDGGPVVAPGVDPAGLPDAPGLAAVVTTSGSTGPGKRVMLSRDALLASARATEQVVGRATWTCALPTEYVAGLMVLVRAFVAGTEPRFADSHLTDLDPASGPNAISIVATQLHRALDAPGVAQALAAFDTVLVGGSRIDPALLRRARAAGISTVTTYGMSETCGGCVYDGVPLPGVDVRVGVGDRVRIGGPQLFDAYLGDPDATAAALVDGWFLTSDRGRLGDDGRLQVLGRLDSVVISGGTNVDLDAVRAVLAAEPIASTVVGVEDDEWGTRVVLIAEPGRTLEAWRDALRDRLGPAALPTRLVEVDKLPHTDRGKLDSAVLQRLARGRR